MNWNSTKEEYCLTLMRRSRPNFRSGDRQEQSSLNEASIDVLYKAMVLKAFMVLAKGKQKTVQVGISTFYLQQFVL